MNQRELAHRHPALELWYAIWVILATAITLHPVNGILSLTGALACGLSLAGRKIWRFFLSMVLPIGLLIVAVNLLFVHRGITVLWTIWDHPITQEALIYGLAAALVTAAMLLWFYDIGILLTGDKMSRIMGPWAPRLSLTLTMVMRFVPWFSQRARQVMMARRAMGNREEGRAREGMRVTSVMTGWALEHSMETTASMKARGYGSGRRSNYRMDRFQWRDGLWMGMIGTLCVVAWLSGIHFRCYPVVSGEEAPLAMVCLGIFYWLPWMAQAGEEVRWRYYRSRI